MKRCFPLHDSIRFETERDKRPILRRGQGQEAEWMPVSTKGRYQTSIPTEYRMICDRKMLSNEEVDK